MDKSRTEIILFKTVVVWFWKQLENLEGFYKQPYGLLFAKSSAEIWSKVRYLEHTAMITLHATCVDWAQTT